MEAYRINNLDFALREQVLEGEALLEKMPRLIELLDPLALKNNPTVLFRCVGQPTKHPLPSIYLNLDAHLPLQCQRCLEWMDLPIALDFEYLISAEMPEWMDDTDDVDWVESSHQMNILALVEDELLAALPIAPTHDYVCKQLKLESGERVNPFSVLKQLKK